MTALALLCPYCASRSTGPGTLVLLGGMILLPFGVTWVVVKLIRKFDQ